MGWATTPSSTGERMKRHNSPLGYRIVAAYPWPAEGTRTNTVQREILAASLEGRVVAPDALADVVHDLGAELVSPMAGTLSDDVVSGTRCQVVIAWGGHHYDLDLQAVGVQRLGVALEPVAPYECPTSGGGGCEDAHVTHLAAADVYLMTYVAVGDQGPRVALASSRDCRSWRRHGLVGLAPSAGADVAAYANKDALLFPESVRAPTGEPAVALLHRPMYERWHGPRRVGTLPPPAWMGDKRPSIWISYCPTKEFGQAIAEGHTPIFGQHHLLAAPRAWWEDDRIG